MPALEAVPVGLQQIDVCTILFSAIIDQELLKVNRAYGASVAISPAERPPSLRRLLAKYCGIGLALTAVLLLVSGRTDWFRAWFCLCTLGSLVMFWATAANRFFSATVRIQAERGHVVIESGPYRYVRRPGYSGALAFTIASPVAPGSWIALAPALLVAVILVIRTALEDRTLRIGLAGYQAYMRRTPKRLLPGVW